MTRSYYYIKEMSDCLSRVSMLALLTCLNEQMGAIYRFV